ncbi:MAG: hypothetical protein WBA57_14190 [Elainellaceae cyanobacterium]
MKMQQLKDATYRAWENLSRFNGAVVQPQTFKPEMRCFGDLRYKATWEKAYCNFAARNKADACLDAYELITVQFNYALDHSAYDLRHQIFDAFMALPEGADLLKTGLDQLLGDFTAETKAEAHGFYRLVQEHPGGLRGDTARPIKQLIAAY